MENYGMGGHEKDVLMKMKGVDDGYLKVRRSLIQVEYFFFSLVSRGSRESRPITTELVCALTSFFFFFFASRP